MTAGLQRALVDVTGLQRNGLLGIAVSVNGAAVVGADIVALTVALRRVMAFPELDQHLFQIDLGRVEGDLDHFGVVALRCLAGAQQFFLGEHGFVGAGDLAVGVAAFDIEHAGNGGHALLGAPETAHAEHDAVGNGRSGLILGGLAGRLVVGAGANQKAGRDGQDDSLYESSG